MESGEVGGIGGMSDPKPLLKVISNKEHPIPKANQVLGAPRRNAKHQLGKVICEGIVRDFRGQFVSVFVDSLLEITLALSQEAR